MVTAVIDLATYPRRMQFWYLLLCFVSCGNPDAYTAQTFPQAESYSKVLLASDSNRESPWDIRYSQLDSQDFGWTSLSRPCILATGSNRKVKDSCDGVWTSRMEMRALPHYEQEECRVLPEVWWVLDGMSRRRKPIVDLDGLLRQPKLSASKQQCKASFQAQPLKRKGGGKRPRCQREGCWQGIQRKRQHWEKCLFALCLCANVQHYGAVAYLGLRAISTSSCDSHSSAATGQSIYTGFGFGSQESISRVCLDPTGPSGGHGKGRELWQSPDYQRPPRCDISPGTGQERTPGGSRCKSQVEGILDEAPAGEPACMGVSIGLLQNEHGQASRCRSQGAPRGFECETHHPTAQLPRRRSWCGGDSRHGRHARCLFTQGGGKASSAIARSYDNVSLFSWRFCQEGGGRDFRRREHQQKTKGFRNCQDWSLRVGRTLTCQQKAVVTKAKSVTFEVVEAYDCDQCDCAAGNLRWTVLSTEEAGMYVHSVFHEFDYTDPFAASLKAFNLRGELLLGAATYGATEPAVDGVGPHVNDRWCDPRPPQLGYRSIDSSGDHSDHDPFDFDTSWFMQISESSPFDICCQQLLEQRFQELEDHSVENVRICCHGLSGSAVGSRYFVLEHAKLAALKQAVRQNWPEFHDAECKLYFVHPQPQDTLRPSWRTCVHIVAEFIDGRTACPVGAVPALEESVIWDAHGNSNVKHMACYYLQQLHNRDVVSKFDHLCVRAGFRCIVRAEGYRLHPEETTTIVEGAFVQLHAIPQVSAPPIEFADYFWHGDHFLEAGGNLLGHWVSPQITWSFHVLSEEGYLGHRDYSPHASELQSIEHVATVMYHLWNLQTPGALAFTGLIHIGDRSTLHFLGFPVDGDQVPGLVWCDVGLVAPLVTALWLPSVSTVEDFRLALELGDRIPEPSTIAVQTDGLQYLPDDRFKPRIGRLHFLRPVLQVDEEEVAFLQQETAIKISSPVTSDEEHGLCADDDGAAPPSIQVRPNPEIRLAFDQDIPITRRTSEGEVVIGRVIPPPGGRRIQSTGQLLLLELNFGPIQGNSQYSFAHGWSSMTIDKLLLGNLETLLFEHSLWFECVKSSRGCGTITSGKTTPFRSTLFAQRPSQSQGLLVLSTSLQRSTEGRGPHYIQFLLLHVNWQALASLALFGVLASSLKILTRRMCLTYACQSAKGTSF